MIVRVAFYTINDALLHVDRLFGILFAQYKETETRSVLFGGADGNKEPLTRIVCGLTCPAALSALSMIASAPS